MITDKKLKQGTLRLAFVDDQPMTERDEFSELYKTHVSMIRSVVYKMVGVDDCDDLVQDTFTKVWRHRKQYQGNAAVKTWIYRIAVNTCIDRLRKRVNAPLSLLKEPIDSSPNHRTDHYNNRQLVKMGLAALSTAHRTVIVLHCFESLTIEEISKILDIAKGTVKSRLFHAKQRLYDFFKKNGVEL